MMFFATPVATSTPVKTCEWFTSSSFAQGASNAVATILLPEQSAAVGSRGQKERVDARHVRLDRLHVGDPLGVRRRGRADVRACEYRLVVEHGRSDSRSIDEFIYALRVRHVRRVERAKRVQPGRVGGVVRVLGVQERPQVGKDTRRDRVLRARRFENEVGRITTRGLSDEQCVVRDS